MGPFGRREDLRMTTKRLLFALLGAALIAAAFVLAALPASATLRTFEVRLTSGSIIKVTVDVPASMPASQVPLPGQLIQELTGSPPSTPSVPSVPSVPTPTLPPSGGGGSPSTPTTPPSTDTGGSSGGGGSSS